jgi:hypothetical protein
METVIYVIGMIILMSEDAGGDGSVLITRLKRIDYQI